MNIVYRSFRIRLANPYGANTLVQHGTAKNFWNTDEAYM